jgi:diguanylate cyclase (GGDEF)-like protein/PAS domain S-box-containing protein
MMDFRVLDSMRDGVLVIGGDQRILHANLTAADILDLPREELYGKEFGWTCQADEAVHEEVIDTFSGLKAIVEISVHPQANNERLVVLRDITARKNTEQKLDLLARAVEHSVSGIMIVDAIHDEKPIIYVNHSFTEITGYSAAESIGRNSRFLQGQDREQPAIKAMHDAIRAGDHCEVELRNYRKNGEMFWNAVSISPVKDESGRVTHYLGTQTDVSERKALEEEKRFRALHDDLTNLPNLSLIEDRIENCISQAAGAQGRVAVLFIDIDHFKPINDSMGHRAGDQILVEFAHRLQANRLNHKHVARVAGDEFIVVLDQVGSDDDLLDSIDEVMSAFTNPFELDDHGTLYITGSLGVSVYDDCEKNAEQMVQEADIAMYQAKQLGRNTYHFYEASLDSNYRQHVRMKSQLQYALNNEEFFLEFQPKSNLLNGELTGFEALIRWRNPDIGLVSPGEFIPTAEETGLIVPIGRWVLQSACAFNQRIIEQGLADVAVAVNISALQFMRPDFVREIESVLDETGLCANRLELELTESIMMDSSGDSVSKLEQLKALGVRISIDDFGTGYSNLNYLKRLPVDALKVDASFVREVTENQNDAGIVLAIISIAHNLGISVIAEGIETHSQLSYLARNQCDEGQGFLISHPLKESEITAYLSSNVRSWMPMIDDDDEHKQTLLLVDDEPNILRSLSRLLRRDGYNLILANDASEALEKLAMHSVHVIISDQRMPGMSGIELLSKVKEMYPETVRMVLSGYTEIETVTQAINRGAIYRFLTKPWDDARLRENVRDAFRHYNRASADSPFRPVRPGGTAHLELISNDKDALAD